MVDRWFGVGQFLSGFMGQLYPGGDTEVIFMVDFNNFNFSNALKESLKECIDHIKGKAKLRTFIRIHVPTLLHIHGHEVKEIRESINCSQSLFADVLGVSKKTVENWESGKNIPNGSAQRLLALIKNKKLKFITEDLPKIGD